MIANIVWDIKIVYNKVTNRTTPNHDNLNTVDTPSYPKYIMCQLD